MTLFRVYTVRYRGAQYPAEWLGEGYWRVVVDGHIWYTNQAEREE